MTRKDNIIRAPPTSGAPAHARDAPKARYRMLQHWLVETRTELFENMLEIIQLRSVIEGYKCSGVELMPGLEQQISTHQKKLGELDEMSALLTAKLDRYKQLAEDKTPQLPQCGLPLGFVTDTKESFRMDRGNPRLTADLVRMAWPASASPWLEGQEGEEEEEEKWDYNRARRELPNPRRPFADPAFMTPSTTPSPSTVPRSIGSTSDDVLEVTQILRSMGIDKASPRATDKAFALQGEDHQNDDAISREPSVNRRQEDNPRAGYPGYLYAPRYSSGALEVAADSEVLQPLRAPFAYLPECSSPASPATYALLPRGSHMAHAKASSPVVAWNSSGGASRSMQVPKR